MWHLTEAGVAIGALVDKRVKPVKPYRTGPKTAWQVCQTDKAGRNNRTWESTVLYFFIFMCSYIFSHFIFFVCCFKILILKENPQHIEFH